MILAALCAFAAAATAGIFLATRHFLRKRLPVWVALLHGLGGATGFLLVLLIVVRNPGFELARQALYLFIATIALGVVNLLFHIRRVRHRTSLIVLHGLTAVSGVSTLGYAFLFATPPDSAAAAATTQAKAPSQAPAEQAPAAASAAAAPAPAASAETPKADAGVGSSSEIALDESVRRTLAQPVSFDSTSAAVDPASRAIIREVAAALKAHPEIELLHVQGHADERGGDARNLELTRQRAAAVASALVEAGVARSRLRSAGYGSRCPAQPTCRQSDAPATCHSPESWQEDRRVVFLPLRVGQASFRGELVCERAAALLAAQDRAFHAPAAR